VAGKKENEGNLKGLFDFVDATDTFGASTWEQSEAESQRLAFGFALNKAKVVSEDIDILLAGDLMNQCVGSSYGLAEFGIPFLGLYGACSTSAEGLALSSMLCQTHKKIAVVTSSHFCSAERQFRLPLEYGGQRTPTSQWTVTGAGAFILEANNEVNQPKIVDCMIGKIVDAGIKDIGNMGSAMAPAVVEILTEYFRQTNTKPQDYDAIFTGDLGEEGSKILIEIMAVNGFDLSKKHTDCGLIIYKKEEQDVHAGGSGCGCGAISLASYILPKISRGEFCNILYIATGALMSPATVAQKLSIPAIAHLVHIVRG